MSVSSSSSSWRNVGGSSQNAATTGGIREQLSQRRRARGARSRAQTARSARVLWEALETRTLLSVLPTPSILDHVQISPGSTTTNQSTPSIAYDPANPLKMVAVYTNNRPTVTTTQKVFIEGQISVDGGLSWSPLTLPGNVTDPSTSTNPLNQTAFPQATDATVAFDRSDNFYITYSEHTADNGRGVVMLQKFNFASASPAQTLTDVRLYQWAGHDEARNPTLAVDNNIPSFTDPDTGDDQDDPFSGSVYVAWSTDNDVPTNPAGYNPNVIHLIASGDGGQTFSTITRVNDGSLNGIALDPNFGIERNAAPRLVVSQGTVDGRVEPGQLTIIWDDFGTASIPVGSNPPFDLLMSDRVVDGFTAVKASGTTGSITDATNQTGGDIPATTSFTSSVTLPSGFTLADLDVEIGLTNPNVGQLLIQLIDPTGTVTINLLNNHFNGNNVAITPAQGVASGTSLGVINGETIGTVFDQDAPLAITAGTAPFVGHYRPEAGSLDDFDGFTDAQLNGNWTLSVTDVVANTSGTSDLFLFNMLFTAGLTTDTDVQIAQTDVRGVADNTDYALKPPSAPDFGIGPGAVIAADNTLGSFSQFQGRLYVGFVGHSRATGNPANNTDIYLATSDDGGDTWQVRGGTSLSATRVNDDLAIDDGFSEGSTNTGRAQFQPSIAVDQTTGTLVMSWYDARHDAAAARVTTYIGTSIDGGSTFGKQTYANSPNQATDAVTGLTTTIGPIPDNQSAGNTLSGEHTFGFGKRQGLIAVGGRIVPVWSGNLNGGTDNRHRTTILTAPMVTATGPRIVSSTMGPVSLAGDALNPAVNGSPTFTAFEVTFDRPIDPLTFADPTAITVTYRDPSSSASAPGTPVVVASIDPLDELDGISNGFGPAQIAGATRFRITLATPQTATGTYTYAIAPTMSDRVRSFGTTIIPGATTTYNPDISQLNLPIPTTGTGGQGLPDDLTTSILDITTAGVTDIVSDINVTVSLTHTFDGDLTITLVAPDATRVILSNRRGSSGEDFTNTVFDDQAATAIVAGTPPYTGTFRPDEVLSSFRGKSINGTWSLEIRDFAGIDTGILLDWSLEITAGTLGSGDGNLPDQNANGIAGEPSSSGGTIGDVYAIPTATGSAFLAPFNSLTLPIMVSGPRVISVTNADFSGSDNLVLNKRIDHVDVTFDRDMNLSSFVPASVLSMIGPRGAITGPFVVIPSSPRTFRVEFPEQQFSGSYTITLARTIRSSSGEALDSNLDAGLDNLRGTSSVNATVNFVSTNVPQTIGDLTTAGKVVTSTINVTDPFVLASLTVQLNITYANDPDLEAVLIAPDGTEVRLFKDVGAVGSKANFQNTIFDDTATTPIQNGGAPFFGRFNPEQALSAFNGKNSVGIWTLRITSSVAGRVGTLNSWSLTMRKPVPSTGLGSSVADQATASFRIFNYSGADPISHSTFTPIGPAEISAAGTSGRIGGIAIDPSDPSGNTVYVAGASGGIWKTSNFLTSDSLGPVWIPLTDFGPTFSLNMGSIAVFGRNNDTGQSVIFGATGEGHGLGAGHSSAGVGFIRSMDGGKTWTLLDSTNNVDAQGNISAIDATSRDHIFNGTSAYKVVIDPNLSPSGELIVYAAFSGGTGQGIWRSTDTGKTWTRVFSGTATDVVLDRASGVINAVSNPTGNVDIIYGAIRGQGVFISPNRGGTWNQLLGRGGLPLMRDANDLNPQGAIDVNDPVDDPNGPNGAKGRILLAKPYLTGDPAKDAGYQGWLYAVVVTPNDIFEGLYLTKDFGQNWTKIRIANKDNGTRGIATPSNDPANPDYGIFGADPVRGGQGNYDATLEVDVNNPNVIYIGGKRDGVGSKVLRVDTTGVADPYAFFISHSEADGGQTIGAITSPANPKNVTNPPILNFPFSYGTPVTVPTINFTRLPGSPFLTSATIYVDNIANFSNTGTGARWIDFDFLTGNDSQHMAVMRDPLTGKTRVLLGGDHTISTAVDNDGEFLTAVGTQSIAFGNRTGNLQISQFYYGAAQPSTLAAAIAGSMFYGAAQDDGAPQSASNPLATGQIRWPSGTGRGDSGGVATDQTGTGTRYQYHWPCCGGFNTDFFQVNGIGRTFGLIQPGDDPGNNQGQWPLLGTINFAVNPVNGNQIIISSTAGRIFGTTNQGVLWLEIGAPTALDSTQSLAMAFGAPAVGDPTGALNNFMYVGTLGGGMYVTFAGGGGNGTNWIDLSAGLDGSSVTSIITNPTRGSREAYATTRNGVYHMVDASAANATWVNITNNIRTVELDAFGDPNLAGPRARILNSIQADWRYAIPNSGPNPTGATHPALYVGAEGGVYRSLDGGTTWHAFPDPTIDGAPQAGGYMPNAEISDMDLTIGNINPTTGQPIVLNGLDSLIVHTYGRGSFAIRLAPLVLPGTLDLLTADDRGTSSTDNITSVSTARFTGLSQMTAFGNTVRVELLDLTDPLNPRHIGGFDPNDPVATNVEENWTDSAGNFTVAIDAGMFSTDGLKTIGARLIDDAGSVGATSTIQFTLLTQPPVAPSAPDLITNDDTGPVPSGPPVPPAPPVPAYSADDYTKKQTVTFTGTAITGYLVELFEGATRIGFATAAGGTYTILTTSPLAEGAHSIVARQTDPAGNVSPDSAPLTVTVDITTPTAPATPDLTSDTGNPSDDVTSTTQPTFTGTAEPFAFVEILSGNNIIGSANANAGGVYTISNTVTLVDGTYTIRARQTDRAGNVSATSAAPLTVRIDSTVGTPPGPDLAAGSDSGFSNTDNITKETLPTFTGNVEAGATLELFVNGSLLTTAAADSSGFYTITLTSPLADGTYDFTLRQTDGGGNVSAISAATRVIVDTAAPVGTGVAVDAESTVLFTGTTATFIDANPFGTAAINWGDSGSSSGTILGGTPNTVQGSHTYAANGTFSVTTTIEDAAGNSAAVTSAATVRTVHPHPTITGPTTGFSGQPLSYTITTTHPNSATAANGFTYSIDWNDGSAPQTIPAAPGNGAAQIVSHTFLTSGTHTVTVTATDSAAQTGTGTLVVTLAQPPALASFSINGGAPQRSHIDSVAFTFAAPFPTSLTLADNVRLLSNGGFPNSLTGAVLTYNPATGVGSVDLHAVPLVDGDHQLQLVFGNGAVILPINFYKLAGDVDGNGRVNSADVNAVKASQGAISGGANYNAGADINNDGVIDSVDLKIVKSQNGRKSVGATKKVTLIAGRKPRVPSLGFGQPKLGAGAAPVDLIVTNGDLSRPLNLSSISAIGDSSFAFSIAGLPWGATSYDLAPGQSVVIRVYMNTTVKGRHAGKLTARFTNSVVTSFGHAIAQMNGKVR